MRSEEHFTIGDASALSGLPAKAIRYYERTGIIESAPRRENSYRSYSKTDVEVLRFVARARHLGFPLKDVGELLSLYRDRDRASKDVKRIILRYLADLDHKIVNLEGIRDTLVDLALRCNGDDRPNCPIIDELQNRADH